MKKTVFVLIAILSLTAILFTACTGKMNDDMTTTKPNTTKPQSSSVHDTTNDIMGTDNENSSHNGAPESTNNDSALGDAIEDAADGAARANEKIADGVREAQEKNAR